MDRYAIGSDRLVWSVGRLLFGCSCCLFFLSSGSLIGCCYKSQRTKQVTQQILLAPSLLPMLLLVLALCFQSTNSLSCIGSNPLLDQQDECILQSLPLSQLLELYSRISALSPSSTSPTHRRSLLSDPRTTVRSHAGNYKPTVVGGADIEKEQVRRKVPCVVCGVWCVDE